MLQKQTRELMVKAYHNSQNMKEVARNFSVNVSTVWRYGQKEKAGESLEPQMYREEGKQSSRRNKEKRSSDWFSKSPI